VAGSIICGVDDSRSAKGAARVARALAGVLGLELVFVRVLEEDAPEAKVNAIADRLERLSAEANDVDFGAGWAVEAGHPADRLADVARQREAAMIVVGSTGPHSSLLGSISADVSRRAPCPVVVVPPDGDAKVDGLANGRRTVHYNGLLNGGEDIDFAGGIVRFSLGGQGRRG
jgi:nucleotide-binding universal stress UspA family protein